MNFGPKPDFPTVSLDELRHGILAFLLLLVAPCLISCGAKAPDPDRIAVQVLSDRPVTDIRVEPQNIESCSGDDWFDFSGVDYHMRNAPTGIKIFRSGQVECRYGLGESIKSFTYEAPKEDVENLFRTLESLHLENYYGQYAQDGSAGESTLNWKLGNRCGSIKTVNTWLHAFDALNIGPIREAAYHANGMKWPPPMSIY